MNMLKAKVINIKSELLYRSAEDDFFYFNKTGSAYKKLKEAVLLTPEHFKSIVLLADISFIKGGIKEALKLYFEAEKLNKLNLKVISSIANCHYMLENYSGALEYCNRALSIIKTENFSLLVQLLEIKINCLAAQKEYLKAFKTWQDSKNIFDISLIKTGYNINYEILNKKINLHKRLLKSGLKIV